MKGEKVVKELPIFTQRHNFRSKLSRFDPTHQGGYTNPWHQAHWTGLDGQFVVPRN